MRVHRGRIKSSLQWRHNEHNGVSNHQPQDCLFNRLFERRSKQMDSQEIFSFDYYVTSMQWEMTENTPGIDTTHSFSHCAMLRKMDSGSSNHHRLFERRSILSHCHLRAVCYNSCHLQRLSRKTSPTTEANGTIIILQRFILISSISCPYHRVSWNVCLVR